MRVLQWQQAYEAAASKESVQPEAQAPSSADAASALAAEHLYSPRLDTPVRLRSVPLEHLWLRSYIDLHPPMLTGEGHLDRDASGESGQPPFEDAWTRFQQSQRAAMGEPKGGFMSPPPPPDKSPPSPSPKPQDPPFMVGLSGDVDAQWAMPLLDRLGCGPTLIIALLIAVILMLVLLLVLVPSSPKGARGLAPSRSAEGQSEVLERYRTQRCLSQQRAGQRPDPNCR